MAAYERATFVEAPFEEVWDFHSRASGLEALTPGWFRLRVESATGPDGESNPDVLAEGSEIVSSVRPLGVGPRQRWTSRIVDRDSTGTSARFRDEMVDGPFDRWVHTHRFSDAEGGTFVHDRVEYELPVPAVGGFVGPVARVGLEPMFRYRHRRTAELLE